MSRLLLLFFMITLLHIGAIFGFFYAWTCSTLWGLDNIDPFIAIKAMQAMNEAVRNPVFFPAFFLTPVLLLISAILAYLHRRKTTSIFFVLAFMCYFSGALLVTASINVPMNRALAESIVLENVEAAKTVWQNYSAPWQFWNIIRTIASGIALLFTGLGIFYARSRIHVS